jgi:hypothetical protein
MREDMHQARVFVIGFVWDMNGGTDEKKSGQRKRSVGRGEAIRSLSPTTVAVVAVKVMTMMM